MKHVVYTLIFITTLAKAAAGDVTLHTASPVKAGMPNEFVCSVFKQMLYTGVTTATELNGGKKPTGQISAPYEAIATDGYSVYVEKNPAMIPDSEPFITHVNLDPKVQSAWHMVLAAKSKSLAARKSALSTYFAATNVPLTHDEEQFIPDLKMAPHMVAIMVDPSNQKLVLDKKQQDVWNAIFASTASIMSAMEAEDHDAFALLFKDDIVPSQSTCLIQ